MRIYSFTFDTQAEATAFFNGILFANVKSLLVHPPTSYWLRWRVAIHDNSHPEEQDECPVCTPSSGD